MASHDLTLESLKEQLSYDPETGIFTWLVKRRCGKHGWVTPGSIAGHDNGNGYQAIGIHSNRYYTHRLAWFYMTGEWAPLIDHINRDRRDNRFRNLRIATPKQNNENRDVRKDSSTGIKGVQPLPSGRWRASIKSNRQCIHIGCYDTKEEAQHARHMAEVQLFTHGHVLPLDGSLDSSSRQDETA